VATAKVRTRPARGERTPHRQPSIADHILDVAEELFARAGYAATTTRAIAGRAHVNVGQLHYYFESKRALFEAVVNRHGSLITTARRQLLRDAKARWPRGDIPLDVLVDALVRSLLLSQSTRNGARGKTLMQMHARLQTDPDETASAVRADIYDDTTLAYVSAFRRALPHLPARVVYWRVYFMMGAYVWTLLQPGRLEAISRGKCDPGDMETAIAEIVPFLCAGLQAPARGR
jgi:AcrR family transcriptional regulator